ncbi:Serum paraoxonase/arylesterase 2 [Entomortierella chlamydospora]|uniref:Serum paraoxonase/arylesterase 2 n=1 Tax=Entomortierella chlamydospora TaxID=101097 RepID=A0A9P6SUV3_9FUNG|nr:Serum paraoxonase/arylesterase 2 [Entomortierella chlamydospora]KAG0006345.1 Serum paraoxonase/arylesterase 2 [Entomortierella chlamydospora]
MAVKETPGTKASAKKQSSKASKAASTSPGLATKIIVAILVLTAALSYNFLRNAIIDLGLLLGDVQPLNTEGCEVVKGLETCEDIHIHHESGLAFTTCGHAESRKSWFPPIGTVNTSAENAFKDIFVIYDVKSGKYEVMDLIGLPADADRVFHGLDIYERSPTELTIFAVNHRRSGSVIEVLEYTIGDKAVQYKETIKHDLIITPNDIVALGPRSFYVSNDHRHKTGTMREIEETLRRPWSNVIFYSPENTFVAFDNVVSANGMAANKDRSLIILSACHGGSVHVLRPREDHTLEQQDHIKLDFYNDNPSYEPETGDFFIGGHVQPLKMMHDIHTPGKPVAGPSKIVKLHKNPLAETSAAAPRYLVSTVLVDNGQLISTGTVAAIDRKRGVMLVGTAFSEKGLVRCPVPHSA